MNKLESLVTNLELSRKLKEAGVKQDSLYCYVPNVDQTTHRLRSLEERGTYGRDVYISAFTAGELGLLIPDYFTISEEIYIPNFIKDYGVKEGKLVDMFVGFFWNEKNKSTLDIFREQDEADMRAKMLLYLIEHKLITL